MAESTAVIGRDGAVTLPTKLRRRLHLAAGTRLVAEDCQAGILLRPVRPRPAYRYKGRPVYTEEQLARMERVLPDESEWAAELEREARKRHRRSS